MFLPEGTEEQVDQNSAQHHNTTGHDVDQQLWMVMIIIIILIFVNSASAASET